MPRKTKFQAAKESIIQSMAYYFAHYHSFDKEGMDLAMDGVRDELISLFPELEKLKREEFCLCPTCKKTSWGNISYVSGNIEMWCEDCDNEWKFKL